MVDKISNLSASYARPDWLNFIHYSEYKYKIRFVSILRKREDHALISISTILKFSVLDNLVNQTCMRTLYLQGSLYIYRGHFIFTGVTLNFVDSPLISYFIIPVFQFVSSSETYLFPIFTILPEL